MLAALAQDGPLHGLIERREAEPFLLDVQFRKDTKSDVGHVGLYAGLSSILRVFESGGLFRLESHRTYRKLAGFEPQWREWMTGQDLAIIWPDVDFYIQTILDDRTVLPR